MAGDIKRQRKSWTLQDRSKVSINILRANLAEEGDEDAQLDVAKRLLEESSGEEVPETTQNENARLALYWLIKSSEQGNDEATQLLKECLQSGRGLTAQNILDVRSCVTTPKDEKLTFKASRRLYRKLNNGEEFITTAQLLARVNVRRKNVTFEHGNDSAPEELFPDEDNVSEQQHSDTDDREDSTDAVISKGEDAMKSVDLNETFTVPSRAPSQASRSPTKSPKCSFSKLQTQIASEREKESDLLLAMTQSGKKLTQSDLLNAAKDFNLGRIPQLSVDVTKRILSRHKWNSNSFLNMFIFQMLILGVMGNVIQLRQAFTYLILLGILWSSYNLLLWKLRYENFTDWHKAFESVLKEGSWETKSFRTRFTLQYLLPYVGIISLAAVLISFTIEPHTSFLVIVVGYIAMTSIHFGVLQRFLPSWQQTLIIGSALVYYKCPTNFLLENNSEQMLFLHQQIISVTEYFQYLPLSFSAFSVFVWIVLLTTIKSSLEQTLRETTPEVVFTLWLLKVMKTSVDAEYNEHLLGIGLALSMCGIMSVFCSRIKIWKILLAGFAGLMVATIVGLTINEYYGDALVQEPRLGYDSSLKYLEWEEYDTTCHRKAWSILSPAATQIKCVSLYGDTKNPRIIRWKGRISIVRVERITSSFKRTLSGDQDIEFDISVGIFSSQKDDGPRSWQSYLPGSSDSETLAPASVSVGTGGLRDGKRKQDLIDHILNFRTGDKIEFIGKLKGSTAGSLKPQIVDVQSLQCLSCATADYGEFVIQYSQDETFRHWVQNMGYANFTQCNFTLPLVLKEMAESLISSIQNLLNSLQMN